MPGGGFVCGGAMSAAWGGHSECGSFMPGEAVMLMVRLNIPEVTASAAFLSIVMILTKTSASTSLKSQRVRHALRLCLSFGSTPPQHP